MIGIPNLDIFTDFGGFIKENASSFVFNLVFLRNGRDDCIWRNGRKDKICFYSFIPASFPL